MSVVIGADVGGSKTVVVAEVDGQVHTRIRAAGAALRPDMVLRSATTLADAIRRTLAEAGRASADVIVVGAAGAGRVEEAKELARALRAEELSGTVRVTTDGEIALVAAFGQSPGILILAGTGSVGLARDPAGTIHSAGGYGWQMGDEGSGYALGRAALGVVGQAVDGRAEATVLSERVLTATRSSDISRLVRWAAAAGQGEIAGLAPLVLEAAESGDRLAAELVTRAAEDLLNIAISLRRLFPEGKAIPVAIAGGVVQPGPLAAALRTMLASRSDVTPVEYAVDPVLGALSLARDMVETGSG
jgi:N-acetylglucosamine kinase-like BadF-type ATPase